MSALGRQGCREVLLTDEDRAWACVCEQILGRTGLGSQTKGREADGKGPECQLPERNLQELQRARWMLRTGLTGPRGGRGPWGATVSRGPLPDDVHQGGEEGLHLIVEAMLGTQGLDQRGHPAVVMPRHRGEETAGETVCWHPWTRSPSLPGPPGQMSWPPPPEQMGHGMGGAQASLPPLLYPRPWVCAHWCSIWKLRCPLNQSMKSEGSTLQVAASCQEQAGHG